MRYATAAVTTALFSASSLVGVVSGQFTLPGCDFGPEGVNLAIQSFPDIPGTAPRFCFDFEGFERCYYTYIPASCGASNRKVPMVVDIHGLTDCPNRLITYSGWAQRAEEECFVVMLPSASMSPAFTASCWNLQGFAPSFTFGQPDGNNAVTTPCCCSDETTPPTFFGSYETPDDTNFVKLAIDDALARFSDDALLNIDPDRVYMGGHSNGCMTSMSLAAKHSDTIAAVCCQSGALITGFEPDYDPTPIYMVYGRLDTIVIYNGRTADVPGVGQLALWSHDQTFEYLLTANGCTTSSLSSFEDPATGETVGSVVTGESCTNDATVQFLTLDEAGHNIYPNSFNPAGGGSRNLVDTNALAWDFCSAFSRNGVLPPAPTPSSRSKSAKRSKSAHSKSSSSESRSKSSSTKSRSKSSSMKSRSKSSSMKSSSTKSGKPGAH